MTLPECKISSAAWECKPSYLIRPRDAKRRNKAPEICAIAEKHLRRKADLHKAVNPARSGRGGNAAGCSTKMQASAQRSETWIFSKVNRARIDKCGQGDRLTVRLEEDWLKRHKL